jgi:hypothetical protein
VEVRLNSIAAKLGAFALLAWATAVLAPAALAENSYGTKVDDRVAAAAAADGVATHYLNVVSLDGEAVSGQVQIASLQKLVNDGRVDFVAPDLP